MPTSAPPVHSLRSRGVERTVRRDAATGRELWRLTDSSLEDKHTYYDICPWSHDGRFLLFSTAAAGEVTTPFAHDTLCSTNGTVCIIDTATWEIHEVAHGALYQAHPGAFCMWHPSRHHVIFRADSDSYLEVDIFTGESRRHQGIIRQLSPDGESFAVILGSPHLGEQGTAVAITELETGASRELVTRDQLYELTPNRDLFRPEDLLLGNSKWSPDGGTLLVAMWCYPHPTLRRSLYLVDRDGRNARWLTYFHNHHNWTPSGREVMFNANLEAVDLADSQRPTAMCTIPATGGTPRAVAPVGSHPAMHPDEGSFADADGTGVYRHYLADGRREYLAKFTEPFLMNHHGTHPHCVWNRDGSQLLYNSAESGHSQLYLIPSP